MSNSSTSDPQISQLYSLDQRALLVKILAEMRVHSLLMAQAFGIPDDIGALRNEVMSQGSATTTDV